MSTELQDPTDNVSQAPANAPAAPAAPAALAASQPRTIADVLSRMVSATPTEAELADLRTAAEAARVALSEAEDRRRRLRAEIETARTAAQPRPDLVEAAAALVAGEIEARVRAIPLPENHGARTAQARAAITAAELKRTEAELLLPALESMLPEIDGDARRARDWFNRASAAYGTASALRLAATRYLPAVAQVMQIESEIEQVIDQWGGNVNLEVSFLNPATGDPWRRKEVEREIERSAGYVRAAAEAAR